MKTDEYQKSIARQISELKFKKCLFGVSEMDVINQLEVLNASYQAMVEYLLGQIDLLKAQNAALEASKNKP